MLGVSIIWIVGDWLLVQCLIFILGFLFVLGPRRTGSGFELRGLGLGLGLDSVRYVLICLSFWVIGLVMIGRQKVKDSLNYRNIFIVVNVILLLRLVLRFSCIDYLTFYICFERSLIPTLLLILGWGYQPERLQAGVYMLFYTLFASLPLLVSIILIYNDRGTRIIQLVRKNKRNLFVEYIWYVCTVLAFVVKLPIFLVHLWLPKAHVEAPVAGSMVLAGVLLKLGGYGLIRVLPLFRYVNRVVSWVWIRVSLVGGFIVSLICLRQTDIKSLIAYSSVAHMGLVLAGLVTSGRWGLRGAVTVIIGHGFCSSGLFCLANIVYERVGSRSLLVNKGLLNFMPRIALWWFLLRIGNIAAPPTLNLLGEIRLIVRVMRWSYLTAWGLALLSFFRAAYTLYIYSLTQHGKFFHSLYSCCSGKVREYLVLFLHWLPLNLLIIKREIMILITCSNSLIKILVCGSKDIRFLISGNVLKSKNVSEKNSLLVLFCKNEFYRVFVYDGKGSVLCVCMGACNFKFVGNFRGYNLWLDVVAFYVFCVFNFIYSFIL